MLRFVIMLIPLSFILRKTGYGYEVGEDGQTINPLLLMDYVKLSGKTERELLSLVQAVRTV